MDTGDIFNKTKQAVANRVMKTVIRLWQNSSSATQAEFPLESLVFAKPLTQKTREKMSLARGGKSIFVRSELDAGKSPKQIIQEGVSSQSLSDVRRTVKNWDRVKVPYIKHTSSFNLELERKLQEAATDEEAQEALNQVKMRFSKTHDKGENSLLVHMYNIARETGFHFKRQYLSHFRDVLIEKGIPSCQILEELTINGEKVIRKHYVLRRVDISRAAEAWHRNEGLREFLK